MSTSKNKREYLPDRGLVAAVKVALDLKMPLLVTGEPGTGKTDLAYWISDNMQELSNSEEELSSEVYRFNTKTTSSAKDLFYRYDALRHFGRQKENPLHFINFEAFGKAIISSRKGFRPVVLVDEIDKAPRDFPNDVLFEFEVFSFKIEEATNADINAFDFTRYADGAPLNIDEDGYIHRQKKSMPPFLLLTSNSEKNLPDAFLRRCLFYHITFPGEEHLLNILKSKSGLSNNYSQHLQSIVKYFLEIRKEGLKKPPATDELIKWINSLSERGIDWEKALQGDRAMLEKMSDTLPVLAKNKDDWDKIRSKFNRTK